MRNYKAITMHYTMLQTTWQQHRAELAQVRRAVFIDEQKVPEKLEWDEYDESCIHILVFSDTLPIATGRMKLDGHIGRMAVLKPWRNQGVGSSIINALLVHAEKSGIKRVYLHAQTSALLFYQRHGFSVCSEQFMDAGIPHKSMQKKI